MPNRILREGILTSRRIAKLAWPEEVFYRRLMSIVDDFGRYYADPGLLQAACYPRQLKIVSEKDIGGWLKACVSAELVRVYADSEGERYLEVLDFGQQIRAKKSKFPDMRSECVADAEHMQGNARLDVSVSVSVSEDVSEDVSVSVLGKAKQKNKPSKKCPDDFQITDEMREWASAEAFGVNVDRETDKFKDHTFKTAYTDWPGTWRNWMRNAADRNPAATLRPVAAQGGYETPYQRAQREKMAQWAPGIAASAPGAPRQVDIIDMENPNVPSIGSR